MRTNRPHIPLYGISCMESKHIYVYCILFVGSKERHTKTITILRGMVVGIKSNLFSGTHRRLSPCTSRKHAIIFCQLSLCAILNRALRIFFPFLFGLCTESHFKQWPEQVLRKKKKKRKFVLRLIACVLWESPDHFKRGSSILFSLDRELQCKNESAPLLEFYRQLENKRGYFEWARAELWAEFEAFADSLISP